MSMGVDTTHTARKIIPLKLKKPENDGQINDWKTWCPNAKIGEIIDSPINPILY